VGSRRKRGVWEAYRIGPNLPKSSKSSSGVTLKLRFFTKRALRRVVSEIGLEWRGIILAHRLTSGASLFPARLIAWLQTVERSCFLG
jgi:hypothetical protein